MRLLDLHARILDYRWNNLKLPEQLADAVPQALLFDPLSGQSFAYEKTATGYSLFSRGVPETGKIELKYRRDPNANLGQGDAGGVPPP
jgi:hypothetical protein